MMNKFLRAMHFVCDFRPVSTTLAAQGSPSAQVRLLVNDVGNPLAINRKATWFTWQPSIK
jgi:hypothetical protein